jgi:hypothetical protein
MVTFKVTVTAEMPLSLIAGEGKQFTAVRCVASVTVGRGQDKMERNAVISSVLGCAVELLCVWVLRLRQLH